MRKFFHLGSNFVPSNINYQELAQNIEWYFKDLTRVQVISIHHPPEGKFSDLSDYMPNFHKIALNFRAKVIGEELLQEFQCRMSVIYDYEIRRLDIFVSQCRNSKNLIINGFHFDYGIVPPRVIK